jgi:hypothetical protein
VYVACERTYPLPAIVNCPLATVGLYPPPPHDPTVHRPPFTELPLKSSPVTAASRMLPALASLTCVLATTAHGCE